MVNVTIFSPHIKNLRDYLIFQTVLEEDSVSITHICFDSNSLIVKPPFQRRLS